ncbi:ATP-binding protein [Streptomyces sp. M54]|uniref:ATP-binding protein n=1 Tax=Streptomyces TaxID=1883 RepID=UPI001A8F9171|nr:ATP-binding protein [Streptomyces sp. M54]QSS89192.1 ATP-binding protein [Streptomyces sp. M54]
MTVTADVHHGIPAPTPASAGRDETERSALWVMPAAPETAPVLRRLLRHAISRWEVDGGTGEAVALVVTELAANAIRHSGSTDVAVLLARHQNRIVIQVKDTGRWLPRPPCTEADSEEACGGRGLQLVRAYTTRCTVTSGPSGTLVVAEMPATPDTGRTT